MTSVTPRLLCIMGSGETAPTMVSVHQDLMARVGCPPAPALMLDTPYGFEENAAGITAKAIEYFAHNVGRPIDVVPLPDFEAAEPVVVEELGNALRDSRYIFAGPGSPSYALRQWRSSPVGALVRERLRAGGCVTFASAAATTLGRCSLPVYEIYKVGERPHWHAGLAIMDEVGLAVAVVPHYDNKQGGSHDTRYCYMGERRLLDLERQLETGVAILGVAEHTAAIFDLDSDSLTVRGRGFVAVRRAGAETRFGTGQSVPLAALREGESNLPGVVPTAPPGPDAESVAARARFEAALQRGEPRAALVELLDAESRLSAEVATTGPAGAPDRSEFRGMLVRLAEAADGGQRDVRDVIAPFVELALRIREVARQDGRFADADLVREGLLAIGVRIQDSRDGTTWST